MSMSRCRLRRSPGTMEPGLILLSSSRVVLPSLQQLGNAMTSAELEAALVTARKDVADLRTKMAALKAAQASGGLVTEKERTKAKATLERYRKAWKDRKNIVTDVSVWMDLCLRPGSLALLPRRSSALLYIDAPLPPMSTPSAKCSSLASWPTAWTRSPRSCTPPSDWRRMRRRA